MLPLFIRGGKLLIKSEWVNVIWGILGFLMFSSGLASQNVVTMTVGLAVALGSVSLYLTSHVKSDNRVKRALEVVFMVASLGVFGIGYIITQSLLIGLMTALILVGVTAAYLLPKIRNNPKNTN